jgi:neutral ceramidase
MALLLSVGGAYALASWDWCPRTDGPSPKIVSRLQSSGPLSAGAGTAEIKVPFPIVAAGYGPPRPELSSAAQPLMARATVLRAGDVTFGLVTLDLLLVPDDVAAEVRSKAGLSDVWVTATHSHSAMGGYDSRLIAQLAGTGRFRADARAAVVDAAVAALKAAATTTTPIVVSEGHADAALATARTQDTVDARITKLELGDVAQWLMLAAHPTTVARPAAALDPDWPGRLASASDAGVTLVLQTAVGNARAQGDTPEQVAAQAAAAFDALTLQPVDVTTMKVTRVQLTPPAPDATRLVPRLFAMPGHNFLCASAPRQAEVGILELGPLVLVAVPAELTHASAQSLGVPVISLANGYLGYVEPAEVVERSEGEARRQYYDKSLLDAFRAAIAAGR